MAEMTKSERSTSVAMSVSDAGIEKMNLVMQTGKVVMLTYPGERHFTQMHPRSKWRIT